MLYLIVNYQFSIINSPFGGLAQLARAPALQAGGQRFESVILHLSGAVHWALSPRHQALEKDL